MASVRPIREAQLTLISEILNNTQKYNVGYTPQAKIIIELHLQQVLTCYQTLNAVYENYTYNDGRTIGMIKLTGTVPIYYSNVKYNIPVALWISERYPNQPPAAYVTPLDNMIIKPNHSYVDASGMVRTPYLFHWHPERCDLVGMVEEMAQIFGNEPPLFARPSRPTPTYSQPSPTPIYRPPGLHSGGQGYSTGPTSRADVVMQTDNGQGERFPAPHPQQQKTWTAQGPPEVEAAKQQFRQSVVNVLKDRIVTSVRALEQNSVPKSSQMEETYNTLMTRAQEIQQGIGLLQEERLTYEHNVQIMALIVGEMTEWRNKISIPEGSSIQDIKAEDVIVPQDAVTAQFLKAQAEDLAAEDVLNILDQMLQKEVIDLDNYLKQVRTLRVKTGGVNLWPMMCRSARFVAFSTLPVRCR